MTTEILGFLIIAGAAIVLFLHWQMKNKQQKEDIADLETSVEQIRYKMEHSADEIIMRMTTHIDRLETLVAAADERAARLEAQIKELKQESERQKKEPEEPVDLAEIAAVEAVARAERLNRVERTDASEFSQLLDASLAQELPGAQAAYPQAYQQPYEESNAAYDGYQQEYVQQPVYQEEAYLRLEPVYKEPLQAEPVYTPEARPEMVYEAEPQEQVRQEGLSPAEVERVQNSLRQNIVSPSVKARQLLLQGYSTEEVAKMVHMGRGAVELLRGIIESGK